MKQKRILLAGTKPSSIGRYVGNALHKEGWDVWLYSRQARKVEKKHWHERACDITSIKSIRRLLCEIKNLDVVMFLADVDGHGILERLKEEKTKACFNAKLLGSVLLSKELLALKTKNPIKLIWCAGKTTRKPKDIILYGIVNAGIASLVEELNGHYAEQLQAYYLSTGIISPSTLGERYLKEHPEYKKIVKHPDTVLKRVGEIIEDKFPPGMLQAESVTL